MTIKEEIQIEEYKRTFAEAYKQGFIDAMSMYKTESQTEYERIRAKEHIVAESIADMGKTEPYTEPLEQFRVGLEYHTDTTHFGKMKGESITTNKIEDEPQTKECPFDDPIPCEWVCTEYGKCKYKPKTEPQLTPNYCATCKYDVSEDDYDLYDMCEPMVEGECKYEPKYEPQICDFCKYYNSNIPCGSTPSACKKADKFVEEFISGLRSEKNE